MVPCDGPQPRPPGRVPRSPRWPATLRFYYERPAEGNGRLRSVLRLGPGRALCVGLPTVGARTASGLLPEAELADDHRPVGRLAHVVDGQSGDPTGVEGLHLDSGAVHRLHRRLHGDVVVTDLEVDHHRSDEQGVT